MKTRLIDTLRENNIIILGFGAEGQSTYRLIRRWLPEKQLAIADKQTDLASKHPFLSTDAFVDLYLGDQYTQHLSEYSLIMKSPGIPMSEIPDHEQLQIESQASLFIRIYRDQITGITGTKGKSTTTTLLWNIFKQRNEDAVLVGNMGFPPFDIVENIGPDTLIAYELSSHQLEKLKVSPKYAMLLNIFQEHLDHYSGYEAYQQAKLNLVRYQNEGDFLIYCQDNALVHALCRPFLAERAVYAYSQVEKPLQGCYSFDDTIHLAEAGGKTEVIYRLTDATPLKGRHNVMNIMAAITAARLNGISDEQIARGIESFEPLPHRLEYAGQFQGIHFYNDSIATIPEATLEALKALGNVNTLILGGKDRKIDYRELLESPLLQAVDTIIFMGEAGERMKQSYRLEKTGHQQCFLAKSFEEVVGLSLIKTKAGGVCLLSPAAASYDWFYNFEERGTVFKHLIRQNT
jgi:UDP-N-acetylmuramoyl-L-alanine---L-glutamate ligase